MTAAHFVLIPAVLLVGMSIGWILGSRAAADAYGAELKSREERAARKMNDRLIAVTKTKSKKTFFCLAPCDARSRAGLSPSDRRWQAR